MAGIRTKRLRVLPGLEGVRSHSAGDASINLFYSFPSQSGKGKQSNKPEEVGSVMPGSDSGDSNCNQEARAPTAILAGQNHP